MTSPDDRPDDRSEDRPDDPASERPAERSAGARIETAAAVDATEPAEGEATRPAEEPNIFEALGGKRGLIDSGLPGLLFVIVYLNGGRDLAMAAWAAVGAGVLLLVARLVARQTVQFALSGFLGVAIAAGIAWYTKRPENYFVPGIMLNGGLAVISLVSILARWPFIGVLLSAAGGTLTGEWRKDPARLRAYTWASWIWFATYAIRVAVQLPLYRSGELAALGVLKVALGWPLLAVAIGGTYLIVRRIPSDAPRPDDERPPPGAP